jgi:hypothetical protein
MGGGKMSGPPQMQLPDFKAMVETDPEFGVMLGQFADMMDSLSGINDLPREAQEQIEHGLKMMMMSLPIANE